MNFSSNKYFYFITIKSVAFLYFIFSFILSGFPQGQTEISINPKGDTVLIQAIPVQEINKRYEENNERFNKTLEIIKPNKDIYDLDTIVQYATNLLNSEHSRIKDKDEQLTIRNIDDLKRQWVGYDEALVKWQTRLTSRIVELENEFFEISKVSKTWKLTRTSAVEQKSPTSTIERIDEIMKRSIGLEKDIKIRKDSVLILQNKITDFQIQVSATISHIDEKKNSLQSAYFFKDSPTIWQGSDSTLVTKSLTVQFKESFIENIRLIELFFRSNKKQNTKLLIISILILVLFYGLFYVSKQSKNEDIEKTDPYSHIILLRFYASAIILSLLFTLAFYKNIPTIIRELVQILMLLPAIILIPKLIDKRLLSHFYYLVILFLYDELQIFFIDKTLSVRFLAIIEAIVTIWLILKFCKKINEIYLTNKTTLIQTINVFKPVYVIFLLIAALSNIFGYVNLSNLLINACINSILVAVLLILISIIANTFLYNLFNSKLAQFSIIIKQREQELLKKARAIIHFIAIIIWVRSILISLGLSDQFGMWLMGLMDVKWELRSAVISFGGIISFFLVILVTSLLTKFLKVLMEEEIFPRVRLGRGVPGTISMVVRYTVVAFGIYIAISAIGVDLGKFGLIAGALGVGIGFGLQGVVYNFIAGLILAFERPIQKGDTIEIGTLTGDVTNIGVRASTVRTYDGSEVIVPNGNLISKELINWTLSDRKRRRVVPVSVAYGSKPSEVMDLLLTAASEHPEVLKFPKPWPLFEGFGDSGLNFKVLFWVDLDRGLTVQSEVAMNIYDALEKAGINIPFPQQDLHIKSFDPTIQKIIYPGSESEKN